MKVSKDAKRGAKALYAASLSGGRLDEAKVKQALSALTSRRPAGFAQILHEYHRLVRLEMENRTAVVESAASLRESEQTAIQKIVQDRLGQDVRTRFALEPELIGGVRIRVGSHVFENSVRGRLDRLRWDLAH